MVCLSIFVLPAAASYGWENDISVGTNEMSWTYTEQYSENRSIQFKSFIDSELGDNDGFVAAWELLKTDVSSRDMLLETLGNNMDVKIDGSSDSIKPIRVESVMSMESLGPVDRTDRIVNVYEVQYVFEQPLSSIGSRIWFLGEPGTSVTITLPANFKVVSTEGIDEVSIDSQETGLQISGDFGLEGEAVVYFEMGETVDDEKEEETPAPVSSVGSGEETFGSLIDEIFPGFTDEFLGTLKGSSSI